MSNMEEQISATRDTGIDLEKFTEKDESKNILSNMIHTSNNNSLEDELEVTSEEEVINEEVIEEPKEELTELQKAMRAKKEKSTGIEVDPALQNEDTRLRNIHDTEENREGFTEAISEQDQLIDKAKKVVVYNRPENQIQRAELMDELAATTINEDGTVTVPENAKYIVARTPEIQARIDKIKAGEVNDDDIQYEDLDNFVKAAEKDKIVKILIDKTGLGVNIKFDDEENKAIEESTLIHLVEVEDQELQTISFEAADENMPFLQTIDTYQLSVSKAPMAFVASGFKAEMTGMSTGDYMDIAMDTSDDSEDYLSFEKLNLKLSVIYNNMVNISIGKFASYEDFLKSFAYADIEPATFGLLIATQPEIDEVGLKCNGSDCNKRFDHKYSPRTLIDFDTANNYYLKRLEELSNLNPKDNLKYALASPVRRGKRFILPQSKYIIDFKMISCFDYLYGLLPLIKELSQADEDAKNNGDDENLANQKKWTVVPLLNVVGAVSIKQKDGKVLRFTDMHQIIDILTKTLPPSDMKILNSAYKKYLAQFYVGYSLKDVKCPHCGRVTKAITLRPDDLVFLINQRQEDSEISFDNFLDF